MSFNGVNGVDGIRREQNSTYKSCAAHKPVPIAVIGLAGRFPGDATDAGALWEMCCEGRSAWSKVPEDRMSQEAFFHPNVSKHGCVGS